MKKTLFAAVVLFATTVSTTHSMQQLVRVAPGGMMGKLKNARWKSEGAEKAAVQMHPRDKAMLSAVGLLSTTIAGAALGLALMLDDLTKSVKDVHSEIRTMNYNLKYTVSSTIETQLRLNCELQEKLAKSSTQPRSFFSSK